MEFWTFKEDSTIELLGQIRGANLLFQIQNRISFG